MLDHLRVINKNISLALSFLKDINDYTSKKNYKELSIVPDIMKF